MLVSVSVCVGCNTPLTPDQERLKIQKDQIENLTNEIAVMKGNLNSFKSKAETVELLNVKLSASAELKVRVEFLMKEELEKLKAREEAVEVNEKLALTTERDKLTAEIKALTTERDKLTAEIKALTTERDKLPKKVRQ